MIKSIICQQKWFFCIGFLLTLFDTLIKILLWNKVMAFIWLIFFFQFWKKFLQQSCLKHQISNLCISFTVSLNKRTQTYYKCLSNSIHHHGKRIYLENMSQCSILSEIDCIICGTSKMRNARSSIERLISCKNRHPDRLSRRAKKKILRAGIIWRLAMIVNNHDVLPENDRPDFRLWGFMSYA